MILESTDSLAIVLHVITVLATPLHVFGTYCILFKTPSTMGSVKWIMLNLHIWSMILDYGFTVIVVPVLTLPAIAGYTLGILRYWFGVPTVYQVYLILSLLFTVCVSIVFIFENRYFQLFRRNSSWRYWRVVLISVNYILSFTYLVPAILTVPDQKIGLDVTYKQIPNLLPDYRPSPIFVFAIEYTYLLIPYTLMTCTVFTESMVFIGLIYWNMNSNKTTQSQNTVKMQRKFLKAIYAQAIVFLVNLLAPTGYILFSIFTDYYNQGLNNCLIVVLALHGINSTLCIMWAHKPYRDFCYSFFIKKVKTTKVTSAILSEETRRRNTFVRVLH